MNNETNLLSICRRAGKLVMGTDAVKTSCKNGSANCVLLAADVSPKTLKELRFTCSNENVPLFQMISTMDICAKFFGKRVGVYAVTDQGFYIKFATMIEKIELID